VPSFFFSVPDMQGLASSKIRVTHQGGHTIHVPGEICRIGRRFTGQ
jgi:hypothetical protein